MNRFYRFTYGKYRGYDLGTVYLFDQSYIEWSIDEVERFYVEDLDILLSFKVIKISESWSDSLENIYMTNPIIDYFSSFQEFIDNVEFTETYIMDQYYIDKNNSKKFNYRHSRNYSQHRFVSEEETQPDDNSIVLMEEAGNQIHEDDYYMGLNLGSSQCPACGAIGDPYCCNYRLEQY